MDDGSSHSIELHPQSVMSQQQEAIIAGATVASSPNQEVVESVPVELGQDQLITAEQQVSRRQRCIAIFRQEKEVKKHLLLQYSSIECMVYSGVFPAWLLLTLRLIMACISTVVFLGTLIYSPYFMVSNPFDASVKSKRHHAMCFQTFWSYLVVNLYFISTVINTISLLISSRCQRNYFSLKARDTSAGCTVAVNSADQHAAITAGFLVKFGLRLQWLLYIIACNTSLLVTMVYFGFIYPHVESRRPFLESMFDVLLHGFNTVFMFADTACSGMRVRLVQAVHIMLFGLVYILFTVFYWIRDHNNVLYVIIMDWNSPGITIGMLSLIFLVIVPIIQLVWWLVYLVRCFVVDALVKLCSRNSIPFTRV